MRRLSLCFILLALPACPGFGLDAPRRPTWNDQCQPSDSFYVDLANSREDSAQEGEIPGNPSEALKVALEKIKEAEIEIEPKAEGFEAWDKFTTTLPHTIYVSKSYPTQSEISQASTLWHELVHVREYKRHGLKKFFAIYSFPEGRWALEVQAYRESLHTYRLWGESEENLRAKMQYYAEKLYDGYDLFQMPRKCAINTAIEIWMQDTQ